MAQHNTYTTGVVYRKTVHDAITADVLAADAVAQICAGAKAIALELTEGGTVNNRSAVFKVYISVDNGATFFQYNMIISNVANTNVQTLTRVASVTRSSAGTDIVFFDPATLGAITHFKVEVDVTDGASPTGSFSVKSSIVY